MKKSIVWEIHSFQASLLKISAAYSSIQKLCFLKVSATKAMWWGGLHCEKMGVLAMPLSISHRFALRKMRKMGSF